MSDKIKEILRSVEKIVRSTVKKVSDQGAGKGVSKIKDAKIVESVQKIAKKAPEELKKLKKEVANVDRKNVINTVREFLNNVLKKSKELDSKQLQEKVGKMKLGESGSKVAENVQKVFGSIAKKTQEEVSKLQQQDKQKFAEDLKKKLASQTKEMKEKLDKSQLGDKVKKSASQVAQKIPADMTGKTKQMLEKLSKSKMGEKITESASEALSKIPADMKEKLSKSKVGDKITESASQVLPKIPGGGGGGFLGDFRPSRPMKFPYTFTAKLVQFPYKYYFDNNWMFRYYCYAVIVCLPIFYKFHKMANTKENKAKWKEIRRKEAEEAVHH